MEAMGVCDDHYSLRIRENKATSTQIPDLPSVTSPPLPANSLALLSSQKSARAKVQVFDEL